MRNFIIITLISTFIILSCKSKDIDNKTNEQMLQEAMEYAYFEGQKDAINNDFRIKKNDDGCYVWIKSCWNNGKEPLYKPNSCESYDR